MTRPTLALLALALTGCPEGTDPDGGSCTVEVAVGELEGRSFVELADGDPVEMLLGFQGFRMLRFAVRSRGPAVDEIEVGSFLTIVESGVELDQRSRERDLAPLPDGVLLQEYLLFVNDIPPAQIVGYDADLEMTVHAAGCVGGARVQVAVRDDDPCVDHGIVLDAATRPDAPDGGVVCE
ncbi:MAG: hypothetical protein H6719_37415 [Sandaracinaceae bacterium]|nr:hypothetical protein [Sandaracinaceae bacterium]